MLTRPTNHAEFCFGKSFLVLKSILNFERTTWVARRTFRSPIPLCVTLWRHCETYWSHWQLGWLFNSSDRVLERTRPLFSKTQLTDKFNLFLLTTTRTVNSTTEFHTSSFSISTRTVTNIRQTILRSKNWL